MLKIVNSLKCGWYSGRANKLFKAKKYTEALSNYLLAMKYSDNEGGRASYLECAAKISALLGDYEKAILYLKDSLLIYQKYKDSSEFFECSFKRVSKTLQQLSETTVDSPGTGT